MRDCPGNAKRAHLQQESISAKVSEQASYTLPDGIIGLKGPVTRPEPGTLPLRGDLAHIALAGRFLAAHYVIPMKRVIGSSDITLKLNMRQDADDGATLPAGTPVELLDQAGEWVWITLGPDGPSGYVTDAALLPESE